MGGLCTFFSLAEALFSMLYWFSFAEQKSSMNSHPFFPTPPLFPPLHPLSPPLRFFPQTKFGGKQKGGTPLPPPPPLSEREGRGGEGGFPLFPPPPSPPLSEREGRGGEGGEEREGRGGGGSPFLLSPKLCLGEKIGVGGKGDVVGEKGEVWGKRGGYSCSTFAQRS